MCLQGKAAVHGLHSDTHASGEGWPPAHSHCALDLEDHCHDVQVQTQMLGFHTMSSARQTPVPHWSWISLCGCRMPFTNGTAVSMDGS